MSEVGRSSAFLCLGVYQTFYFPLFFLFLWWGCGCSMGGRGKFL